MGIDKLAKDALEVVTAPLRTRDEKIAAMRMVLTFAEGGGYLRCMEEFKAFMQGRIEEMAAKTKGGGE